MHDEKPGRDWPDVECTEHDPRSIRERARMRIAFIILSFLAIANATAAVYGYAKNDWDALRMSMFSSWPILWMVIAWYFGRGNPGRTDELDFF